jgi:predicted DsbA family dithiol-disulfide isomerase
LERLNESHQVEILWHSFELRPSGGPSVPPEDRKYIEQVDRPRMGAIAREHYGIEIKNVDIGRARRYGIDAVPALIFNHRYLVSGAQPYEALRDVVVQIKVEAGPAET